MTPVVTPFVGRESQLSEIKLFQNDPKLIVITGSRGAGKSELARKYAEEYKKDNVANIIWLNSDSVTSVVDDLKKLATQVGVSLEGKKITQVVREIFHFFKDRKALFIFDAARADNVLLKHLKSFISDETNTKILITSRDLTWDKSIFNPYYLGSFSTSEAVKYIKIALKDLDIPTDETHCEKLAKSLENLPLALKKSTDYIIKQNSGGHKYTIDDFVKQLSGQDILSTPAPQPADVDVEIEQDVVQQIKDETEKIGDKIASEATQAWEKVSEGASHIGSQISQGAQTAGREIASAAKSAGHEVKKFFSGFG